MRFLVSKGRFLLAGALPGALGENDDVSKETKTYQRYLQMKPTNETGWDRLKDMFTLDEFDGISNELNAVYQAGFLGFLVGAIYGGIVQSRSGYMNFMENNQATAFKSHLDAKRKLQDQFTVNFAKGGFKWGWRVGLFTTSYYGIITGISVYRGKSSIWEYLAAGSITGAMYKMSLGLRGMAAGGIIGGALGGVAGAASLLIMNLTGTSMEDVRYWQYKWRLEREDSVREALKVQNENENETPDLIKQHDDKQNQKISLDNL